MTHACFWKRLSLYAKKIKIKINSLWNQKLECTRGIEAAAAARLRSSRKKQMRKKERKRKKGLQQLIRARPQGPETAACGGTGVCLAPRPLRLRPRQKLHTRTEEAAVAAHSSSGFLPAGGLGFEVWVWWVLVEDREVRRRTGGPACILSVDQ